MLKCDGCGIDLCYTVRYKGTYFCNDCSPVMEINKEDYLKVVEENKALVNSVNNSLKEICERNKELLKQDKEIKVLKRSSDYFMNHNKHKELESMTKLCNERGKRIEVFETHINELKRVNLNLFTEGSGKSVNEIKCCLECQVNGLEEYLKSKNFSKLNHFIKNSLKEDCEVCKGKAKKVEMSSLYGEYGKNNFVDSWMLSYKVKGMKEPIIQHHLTKEECEIIYGNMNNVTYWFMELMGE